MAKASRVESQDSKQTKLQECKVFLASIQSSFADGAMPPVFIFLLLMHRLSGIKAYQNQPFTEHSLLRTVKLDKNDSFGMSKVFRNWL